MSRRLVWTRALSRIVNEMYFSKHVMSSIWCSLYVLLFNKKTIAQTHTSCQTHTHTAENKRSTRIINTLPFPARFRGSKPGLSSSLLRLYKIFLELVRTDICSIVFQKNHVMINRRVISPESHPFACSPFIFTTGLIDANSIKENKLNAFLMLENYTENAKLVKRGIHFQRGKRKKTIKHNPKNVCVCKSYKKPYKKCCCCCSKQNKKKELEIEDYVIPSVFFFVL